VKARLVYHFTHTDNLDGVLSAGALRCDAMVEAAGALARETADRDLKARRRTVAVQGAGGTLSEYVPFYFAPRSPMLLRVATGRVEDYRGGQDPLVFVVADVDELFAAGLEVMATDGHPVSPLSRFLPDRDEIESAVDWELMTEEYWNDTADDGDRMRRRQAELLVRREVPLAAVRGFAVRTDSTERAVAAKVRAAGVGLPVLVRPSFYYQGKP
jgi:hypothetical protein